MTPERWQQVKTILAAAIALPPAERSGAIDTSCGHDAELREEVESLLAAHENSGTDFLETLALSLKVGAAANAVSARPRVGVMIGPYRLESQLGQGGMADVFAAARADGQFIQRVALKLVRRQGGATLLERLRTERQILAGLEHPNIARLLDGGTTAAGEPYLVMELVDGEPIDDYCRERAVPLHERLRLFLDVCGAVAYAHRRLVIHRDLKPANILVTRDGTVKLLDFGIAKLLDPLGQTEQTAFRPFTPAYASPEQVRGEPVSTTSDVYGLGVVLYRLLTGQLPYRLTGNSASEMAAAVERQNPTAPSAVTLEAAMALDSRLLRGDLDSIVLKALRKEPDQRYSSVEQCADDVRRHLEGRPVLARKGTFSYLAGRFARRHWQAVAVASVLGLTLLGGIAATLREARVAEANRRRAETRFNDVRRLANSLLFEINDAVQSLPGATHARQLILQRSVEYLDSLSQESRDEPALQREAAAAYERIADLQGNPFSMSLGDTTAAAASYSKALSLREALATGPSHTDEDQTNLAVLYRNFGEFETGAKGDAATGLAYVGKSVEILDRAVQRAPDDRRVTDPLLRALSARGFLEVGEGLMGHAGSIRNAVADVERAEALVARLRVRAPDDIALESRDGSLAILLGDALLKLADRPKALVAYQHGREILDRSVARNDYAAAFNDAVVYGKIGDLLIIQGSAAESLKYYRMHLKLATALADVDPRAESILREKAVAFAGLGHVLGELGQAEEGLKYGRLAVATIQTNTAATPLVRALECLFRAWLGETLERQGLVRDASREYSTCIEILGHIPAAGARDPRMQSYLAAALERHAATLGRLNDPGRAVQEYERARALLEPLARSAPEDYEIGYELAEAYTAEGALAAWRAADASNRAERVANHQAAVEWFRRSLAVWSGIPHPARISTSGFEVTLPDEVARQLAAGESALKADGA